MAVSGNKTYLVNDFLWLRSTIPLIGILSLTGFVDNVNGEDGDYSYVKKFRYTKNGLPFVDWINLTIPNISNLSFKNDDIVFFEFKYIHFSSLQTPISHEMSFDYITLTGQLNQIVFGDTYNKSIFGQWFPCSDNRTLSWTFSINEKLYEKGIIPSYLERDIDSDDYISFWKSISMFFSQIVVFIREIGRFEIYKDLLQELLSQRNLFFCEEKMSLAELRLLTDNYFKEMNNRGTWEIINKDNIYSTISINGELLRLICWEKNKEFIFNLTQSKHFGWCIGNSSPMYKCLSQQDTLNKNYEQNGGFDNLAKYPIINDSFCTRDINGNLLIDGVGDGQISGIGYLARISGKIPLDKAIIINPWISYEISFWVKQEQIESYFTFGVHAYDIIGREVGLSSMVDGSFSNIFFKQKSLNQNDEWYHVRGIVYSLYKELDDKFLGIGFGNYLKFNSRNTKYISPYIITDLEGKISISNRMIIKDLQIKPTSTPFSTGWINKNNFIGIWMENKNDKISPDLNEKIIYVKSSISEGSNVLIVRTIWDWGSCFPGDSLIENAYLQEGTEVTYLWRKNGSEIEGGGGGEEKILIQESEIPHEFWTYYIRLDRSVLSNISTWKPIKIQHLLGYYNLENKMKRYLLPYNSNFQNIYMQWDI